MSVLSADSSVSYTGNGSTVEFAVPFVFPDSSDLIVYDVDELGAETVFTEGADYTVSGGGGDTGAVTLLVAPITGRGVRIERDVEATQPVNLRTAGDFSPAVHELMHDRAMLVAQQILNRVATLEDSVEFQDLLSQIGNYAGLLDLLNTLQTSAGLLAVARTWTAVQTFSEGVRLRATSVDTPLIKGDQTVTSARRLLGEWALSTDGKKARLYASVGSTQDCFLDLTFNARSGPSGGWIPDVTGNIVTYSFPHFADGVFRIYKKASATAGVEELSLDSDPGNPKSAISGFASGWAANVSPAYWRDAHGTIHLEGSVIRAATGSGTIHSSMFPAGSRPSILHRFSVPFVDSTVSPSFGTNHVYIATDGSMGLWNVSAGTNLTVYLDGISFRAEQ